jgi:hypothetical protein
VIQCMHETRLLVVMQRLHRVLCEKSRANDSRELVPALACRFDAALSYVSIIL